MRVRSFALAAILVLCLVACANRQTSSGAACASLGPRALAGGFGGAAAGAGLGAVAMSKNRAEGALIGALVGVVAGAMIGDSLDQRDCEQAQAALRRVGTASTGQQVAWNSATGNRGTFMPLSDPTPVPNRNNQLCRQYRRDSVIGGKQTGGDVGVICRKADGDYEVVQ
jgi:surface antigen